MTISAFSALLSSLMATGIVAEVAPAAIVSEPEPWMVKSFPLPAVAVPPTL